MDVKALPIGNPGKSLLRILIEALYQSPQTNHNFEPHRNIGT